MENLAQIIPMIIATPMVLFWVFLYLKYSRSFDEYINALPEEGYPLKSLYFIGMGFMSLIKYDMNTPKARKRIKEIAEIKGEKYAGFFYYGIKAATFTFYLTFLPIAILFGVISEEPVMILVGVCLVILLVRYLEKDINDKLESRREELLLDLPQVLSKMSLLINSGMTLREAWDKVAMTGERCLYMEMRETSSEVENGVPLLDAFRNFADRCSLKQIRKVTSTLIQNMQKGNSELSYFLGEMSSEMWEEKKNLVRQKGEKASTNLLLPIGLIFVGIMLLVIVPVLSSGF